MEILYQNYFNTSTQAVVNSNTSTAQYLLTRDTYYQYVSSGFNNDLTQTTIRINFDATTSVSRIAILNTNAREMIIFRNGLTASTFALTTTSSTVTSSWVSNSASSMYLSFSAVDVTSVSFDIKSTIVANVEKAVAQIVISSVQINFSQLPSAKNYKPLIDTKQIVHELSDGGTRVHAVKDKYSHKVKLTNAPLTFQSQFKTLFEAHNPFMFCPFGTTTSWDAILYEAVWVGNFDFYTYSDDNANAGFTGNMDFRESPT